MHWLLPTSATPIKPTPYINCSKALSCHPSSKFSAEAFLPKRPGLLGTGKKHQASKSPNSETVNQYGVIILGQEALNPKPQTAGLPAPPPNAWRGRPSFAGRARPLLKIRCIVALVRTVSSQVLCFSDWQMPTSSISICISISGQAARVTHPRPFWP